MDQRSPAFASIGFRCEGCGISVFGDRHHGMPYCTACRESVLARVKVVKLYRVRDGRRIGLVGNAVRKETGWRFIPLVSGHTTSRRAWPTWEACVPRWVGHVEAEPVIKETSP
jgi:hypothetical protein